MRCLLLTLFFLVALVGCAPYLSFPPTWIASSFVQANSVRIVSSYIILKTDLMLNPPQLYFNFNFKNTFTSVPMVADGINGYSGIVFVINSK